MRVEMLVWQSRSCFDSFIGRTAVLPAGFETFSGYFLVVSVLKAAFTAFANSTCSGSNRLEKPVDVPFRKPLLRAKSGEFNRGKRLLMHLASQALLTAHAR